MLILLRYICSYIRRRRLLMVEPAINKLRAFNVLSEVQSCYVKTLVGWFGRLRDLAGTNVDPVHFLLLTSPPHPQSKIV